MPKRIKKYQNCANCGRVAVGKSTAKLAKTDELVIGGHIKERPWCTECLQTHIETTGVAGPRDHGDASPGQEGAIREMEDAE